MGVGMTQYSSIAHSHLSLHNNFHGICSSPKANMYVSDCSDRTALCFGVSRCRWEVERISGKLKHSPAQRKTALRSCGPRWKRSWLRLWTQSGPTRTARVPPRNHFPATQKTPMLTELKRTLWAWNHMSLKTVNKQLCANRNVQDMCPSIELSHF